MSPEACFAAAVIAFMIDYWGLGQNAIGDRFSFFLYLAAWASGLEGTGFAAGAAHTVDQVLASASAAGHSAPILVGAEKTASSLLALGLVLWTFFCLLPTRYSNRFGRAAHLSFRSGGQGPRGGEPEMAMRGRLGVGAGGMGGGSNHINWKLLWASVADATVAPLLLHGTIGGIVAGIIAFDTSIVSGLMTAFLSIGTGIA